MKDDLLVKFGKAIRAERKARNLSQRELAAMTKIGQSSLSALERGIADPNLAVLFALVDALGISLSQLLMQISPEI